MAVENFKWIQQNNYSWRGTFEGVPYWVILTVDHKNFILQIPGIATEDKELLNLSFTSFEDARQAAERSVN